MALLLILIVINAVFFVVVFSQQERRKDNQVLIFHLIDNALWGEIDGSALQGNFSCFSNRPNSFCELISSDAPSSKVNLFQHLQRKMEKRLQHLPIGDARIVTVSLYNIHTWSTLSPKPHSPNSSKLRTTLTMAESEESHNRFNKLFTASFPHFDGYSTTHPQSTVPRTYFRGWDNVKFLPLQPFKSLIKGGTFVASTCHRAGDGLRRMNLVKELMQFFRIDNLGKCMHTEHIPEGIVLRTGKTAADSLQLKQQALSRYLFHLAFENTIEPGYVTEKVFDALIAGVVPVYFGSTKDCKVLLPSQKAAIFLSDFNYDMNALGKYLTYLSNNETAYEEHREWRKYFNATSIVASASASSSASVASVIPTILAKSWPCRICEWAIEKVESL